MNTVEIPEAGRKRIGKMVNVTIKVWCRLAFKLKKVSPQQELQAH